MSFVSTASVLCLALSFLLLLSLRYAERYLLFLLLLCMSIRLAEPTLALGPVHLTIAEGAVAVYAVWYLTFGVAYLASAKPVDWALALCASQTLSVLVSLVTSGAITDSTASLLGAVSRSVVIVGTAGMVRNNSSVARWITPTIVAAAVVVSLQALLLPAEALGLDLEASTDAGSVTRVAGLSGGFLPGLLLIGVAWSLSVVLFGRAGRLMGLTVLAVTTSTIVLTYTRGAYLDLVVVALLVIGLGSAGRRSWLIRITFAVGVFAIASAVLVRMVPSVGARWQEVIAGTAGTTLETRFILWKVAVDMFADNAITGVGAGGFNEALRSSYASQVPAGFLPVFEYPEHQLLGLAAETGVVGVFLYLLGLLAIISACFKRIRSTDLGNALGIVGLATTAILVARLVSEMAGTWLSGNDWLTVVLGIALGYMRIPARADRIEAFDGDKGSTPVVAKQGPRESERSPGHL